MSHINNTAGHLEIILFLIVSCFFLSSCGGGAINPSTNTGSNLITVSLVQSGTTTSVYAGTSAVNLTASVANDSASAGVTWNLSPISSCGTLTTSASTAVYTPPATLNHSCGVTVTAI